jgi:hypothetical protein
VPSEQPKKRVAVIRQIWLVKMEWSLKIRGGLPFFFRNYQISVCHVFQVCQVLTLVSEVPRNKERRP